MQGRDGTGPRCVDPVRSDKGKTRHGHGSGLFFLVRGWFLIVFWFLSCWFLVLLWLPLFSFLLGSGWLLVRNGNKPMVATVQESKKQELKA